MGAGGGITPGRGRDVSALAGTGVGGDEAPVIWTKQPQRASPVTALQRLRALRRVWPRL